MRSFLPVILLGAAVTSACADRASTDAQGAPHEPAPAASGSSRGAAVDEGGPRPPRGAPSQTPVWSRGSASSTPASLSPEANAGPAPINSVDPEALGEFLAAAPKDLPKPTGADGASAIGTETSAKEGENKKDKKERGAAAAPSASASAAASAPPPQHVVSIGSLSVQAVMSTPSIERAAREQLYWPLVQRCRDKEGRILPPDSVLILFRVDPDGYIIGSSISATPSSPELEDAAHCMRRELSAATFRAPPGARGMMTSVTMTAPSVD